MNDDQFMNALEKALQEGNGTVIGEIIFDYAAGCYKSPPADHTVFSARVLDWLVVIIQRPDIALIAGSWQLLYLFEMDWGRLTLEQRSKLLPVLISLRKSWKEEAGNIILEELLTDFFENVDTS